MQTKTHTTPSYIMKGRCSLTKRTTGFLSTLMLATLFLGACQPAQSDAQTDTAAVSSDATVSDSTVADTSASADTETEDATQEDPVSYTYEVNTETQFIVPLSEEENKQVALLTFDDAPDKHAVEIAHVLQEKEATAIFFVNGMFLESEDGKQQLKEIYDMGYEIGNHGQTHASLPSLTEEQQYEEIMKTSDLVEEITGERPRFFRAPFGQNTEYTKELAREDGMEVMNWTYGYDWEKEYQSADALTDIMVNTEYLNNGANLLMHDRSWTVEALPGIIDGLREKGYDILDSKAIQSPERKGDSTE